jgi:hypothetical protein
MAVTKVRAPRIWKKSFMTCPRWSGFVLPLPFSDSGHSLILPVTSSKNNKRNYRQLLTRSLLDPQWCLAQDTVILASGLQDNIFTLPLMMFMKIGIMLLDRS